LDRIEVLTRLPETFDRRTLIPPKPNVIEVRIRFAPEVVRWVRERQHYAFQMEEAMLLDGSVVMHYQVNALSEIQHWLLSWGAAAEPLEPAALREQIRQEVQKLLRLLT
jgi:predicted DNA-binding transcriptional regulator YafY